jgi:hypothetical protein
MDCGERHECFAGAAFRNDDCDFKDEMAAI